MTKSVKKSINLLQTLYMNGLIPYPRVSNDFEKEPFFEIFPHPALPILRDINMPMHNNRILINKKSSLLLLSLIKLLKPSKIIKTAQLIDSFYDEDLNFTNKTQQLKFKKLTELLDAFLEKQNITEKEILSLANGFYSEENKKDTFENLNLFTLTNDFFTYTSKEIKINKVPFIYFKKKREKELNNNNYETEYINYSFDGIDSLLEHIQMKNNEVITENDIIHHNGVNHGNS